MVSLKSSRRLFISTVAIVTGCFLLNRPSHATPPMTRQDFMKAIPRGLPKEDVIKLLGKPSSTRVNKKDGLTELTYDGQVLSPKSGNRETVTVVIYDEYQTVQSVRWADGTVAE